MSTNQGNRPSIESGHEAAVNGRSGKHLKNSPVVLPGKYMKKLPHIAVWIMFCSFTACAQQTTFQDSLLEHMIGTWVLRGTIAGKETTHDIVAEWVLGHQYLQIHETSREKNTAGAAEYEAIVYIGWDQPSSQCACLWLDVTGGGGLSGQAIGYAKRSNDDIAFLFQGGDGYLFHTTFAYIGGKIPGAG